MNYALIFSLSVALFLLIILLYGRLKHASQNDGLRKVMEERTEKKEENLESILGLFIKYETITNAIIRQELGFDDRVIVNYMDELERAGKVRQVGKTGKNAHYEKI